MSAVREMIVRILACLSRVAISSNGNVVTQELAMNLRTLIFLLTAVVADAPDQAYSASSPPSLSGTIEPEVVGIGNRIGLADTRFISIHRQSHNQNSGPIVHYFHKPLFILNVGPVRSDGLSNIVVGPVKRIGSKNFLNIDIIMTDAKFREYARAFVIQNDPELQSRGSDIDLNQISVDGWPIITLNAQMVEPLSHRILSEWTSPSLEAAGGVIRIPFGVDDEALDLFRELATAGDIEFDFSYTFRNVRQQYAVSLANASKKLSEALNQAITSANLAPNQPIFQDQASQFMSRLSVELATTVSASSIEMVPLVQSQFIEHYLPSQVVNIDGLQDKALLDAIYSYLKPLVQTASEKAVNDDSTTNVHEDSIDIDLSGSGKVGVAAGKFSVKKHDKDTITQKSGIVFEQSTVDQSYKPHSIRIYKLVQVTDTDTVSVVSRAFVSQGGDSTFELDTPVHSDFTVDKVKGFENAAGVSPFPGVLPGMGFCFYGSEIPKGYMVLDGKVRWPEGAWVPPHLKGTTTPDSNGLLIGATTHQGSVGTVWTQGAYKVPRFVASSEGLAISEKFDTTSATVSGTYQGHSGHGTFEPNGTFSFGDVESLQTLVAHPLIKAAGISGSINIDIPALNPHGSDTNPDNLRCRLIVKY